MTVSCPVQHCKFAAIAAIQAEMPTSSQNEALSDLDLAFLRAERAVDPKTSRQATGRLLDSIGNNHAGTYRAIALDAIPKFASIIGSDSAWAQHAVLEALIDLCGSFEPDPVEKDSKTLANALLTEVRTMKQGIEAISKSESIASASANSLLELL